LEYGVKAIYLKSTTFNDTKMARYISYLFITAELYPKIRIENVAGNVCVKKESMPAGNT
jgi:hypothetical protein